jgi:hypothetical protein
MDVFATGHIDFWVLFVGLFLPRLALFLAWAGFLPYPPNTIPDIVNLLGWLFIPRFLIAYYIYTDMGTNNLWFWAYIVLGIVGLIGETGYTRGRIIRRKTIRNGNTVTTIEEEEV